MTPPASPTLLFDMDGTLVDSTAVVERIWTEFATRHGLLPESVISFAHGRPTAVTVHHFLTDSALARSETARIVADEETTVEGIVEIDGAADLVRRLQRDRWAVVTSAGRTLAHHRLRVAGVAMPDVLISSEDVTRGKPDPEGYLLAAAALNTDIADCVVFEDSDAGVRAGVASGATTIVVGSLTAFDGALRRIPDFADFDLRAWTSVKA